MSSEKTVDSDSDVFHFVANHLNLVEQPWAEGLPYKKDGFTSKCLTAIANRYQVPALWAWLELYFTSRVTNSKTTY